MTDPQGQSEIEKKSPPKILTGKILQFEKQQISE
jgi:hypothetical protein